MKCTNHPDIETEAVCAECQTPVCTDCRITLVGKDYCCACLEKKVEDVPVYKSDNVVFGVKSKFWAFILSLIPGVGYMYLGLMNRGLQTLLIFFGTIFVASVSHIDPLAPFVIPVLMFYTIFDTQQLIQRINEGFPVRDLPLIEWGHWGRRQNLVGYGLIIVGGFSLLNSLLTLLPPLYSYNINRIVPPLLIIGLGLFILYRSTRKGGQYE